MINNPLEKLYSWSSEKIGWDADACGYSGNDRNIRLTDALKHFRALVSEKTKYVRTSEPMPALSPKSRSIARSGNL